MRNTLASLWANAALVPLAIREPEPPVNNGGSVATDSADEDDAGTTVVLKQFIRDPQCVSSQAQRVKVTRWMLSKTLETSSVRYLSSDAVRQFPDVFRSRSSNANLMKASRWFATAGTFLARVKIDRGCLSQFSGKRMNCKRKRVALKCGPGRGRKTAPWVLWLYPLVLAEFSRLKKAGLKFSAAVLRLVALDVLATSTHLTFRSDMSPDGKLATLAERVNDRWIQQFQEVHNIVHRAQTGKLSVSPAKQQFIERTVAFHMGQLARGFRSGELDENLQENMDETHFCINMNNGRTLGFRGDEEVKYADIVSAGVGMTMCVKVTGGVRGRICIPFMIFQNEVCSYPIRGVPDICPGVCYRTAKKGFMTSEVLPEYYKERRVSFLDPGSRKKVQWIDNAPGHKVTPDCERALATINTELRSFPENSTHLTQPCDSFVISKIKDSWTSRWEAKKLTLLRDGKWQGDGRAGTSGMLQNPGKKFFLELAAAAVKDVNSQRDQHLGISYARKAMIRCGLSLNVTGQWEEKQLRPELQEIIKKFPRNYDGFCDGLDPLSTDPLIANDVTNPIPASAVRLSSSEPVSVSPNGVIQESVDVEDIPGTEEDVDDGHEEHGEPDSGDEDLEYEFEEEQEEPYGEGQAFDYGAHSGEPVYVPASVPPVGGPWSNETTTVITESSGLEFFDA